MSIHTLFIIIKLSQDTCESGYVLLCTHKDLLSVHNSLEMTKAPNKSL